MRSTDVSAVRQQNNRRRQVLHFSLRWRITRNDNVENVCLCDLDDDELGDFLQATSGISPDTASIERRDNGEYVLQTVACRWSRIKADYTKFTED